MEWDPLIIKQQARPEGYLNGIGIGCGRGQRQLGEVYAWPTRALHPAFMVYFPYV